MRRVPKPVRGDVVQLDWVDIYEDPVGDPEKAALKRRTSYALFWERRADPATGIDVIITTTTIDEDASSQQGYCIYPAACVVGLNVIKHTRKPAARK
jgi:hypothetical protein